MNDEVKLINVKDVHSQPNLSRSLAIQLRIMPENPFAIRHPPLTRQILFQPTLSPNALIESPEERRELLFPGLHLLRESEQTPIQNLPNNQIRKSQPIADQVPPLPTAIGPIEFQIPLKVRKELRNPVLPDTFSLLQRSLLLLFVVLRHSERMVRIMDLVVKIQRRENQLVDMVFPRLIILRHQTQTPSEVDQDVWRLRDDQRFAGFACAWDSQGGWAENRRIAVGAFETRGVHADFLDGLVAVVFLDGEVGVGDAGCFEAEADEFAAAGDAGVVEEFVLGVGFG